MSNLQTLRERAGRIAPPAPRRARRPERPEVPSGGSGIIPVVIRAADEDAYTLTVQRVRHTNWPPQEGYVTAYGPMMTAYPLPGHTIDSLANMPGLVRPVTADEVLGVRFYVCLMNLADYTVWLPVKMPSGVEYTDADEQTTEGGGV